MSKYEEAYKLSNNLTPKDLLDKKVREAVDLVKEACDKAEKYDELAKTLTLEEVKKEWEELGYEWREINLYIRLIQNKIEWQGYTKEIYIDKGTKTYCCFNEETEDDYLYIEPLEHQLLTKTFKALRWM